MPCVVTAVFSIYGRKIYVVGKFAAAGIVAPTTRMPSDI
jgi:hypothetical protein